MKLSLLSLAGIAALVALVSGCAPAAARPAPLSTPPLAPSGPFAASARAKFEAALAAFVRHDEAHDWTPASCAEVAAMFDDARAQAGGVYPQAAFDAGLAHQRCRDHAKARASFEKAGKDDPSFLAAHAKVALYRFEQDGNLDTAIDAVQRAVGAGKFTDVASLVDLAALQMTRDSAVPGPGCKDDTECAKLNLHRALALDDAYMPAHNELALYYLQVARKRAGITKRGSLARQVLTPSRPQKRADLQQLELAALVCSQAIAKNPRYAPLHNTAGIVEWELGRVNAAVAELQRAVDLDPSFFEAQMNYAALNLGFRGFARAEAAYRRAIELRPNDYDAHLGLGVAFRGAIADEPDDDALSAKLAAIAAEIAAAKRIDESRPEAFYNEGLFLHDVETMRARTSTADRIAVLERAEASLRTFLEKAKGKAGFEDAITRASERLQDITPTKAFLRVPLPASSVPATPPRPARVPRASPPVR